MNLRVMPLYVPLIKAIGANPVTMPPTDIYTGMERGVVDGFMWPRFGMISWGLHEVSKYTIEPGLFQWDTSTFINLDRWRKIPVDLQELIMDVMKDHEYIGTMRALLIVEKEERVREKAGMKILKLPPNEAAKLISLASDTTWDQIIKASPDYGLKLKKLLSKNAVPKGTFPWQ